MTSHNQQARTFDSLWHTSGFRVLVMFVVLGVVSGGTAAIGSWAYAPAVGWIGASGTFCFWVWGAVLRLGPADTASHSLREDPTRTTSQTLLILASIASFGAIGLVLIESGNASGAAKLTLGGIALATVTASWFLIHLLFTLRYAAVYFGSGGSGIDFNQAGPPAYRDFVYLAFTLGMTYQVSDTSITSSAIRAVALRHALLSFLFGVVILATTINLVSSLAR